MPPTPPGPSLTLGVTAWRDAVHVGFTGGRAVNLLRMTDSPSLFHEFLAEERHRFHLAVRTKGELHLLV